MSKKKNTTKITKDCPDGVCPIKKPKKKATPKASTKKVVTERTPVSVYAKILSAIKFWK